MNLDSKLRVAIYIRVSTEEQKMHGLSIDAQNEILTYWVKNNGHVLVDYYIDAGITARKKFNHRKELLRLLDDVNSKKIDLIIFTKLDRWFRNIADYYKVQEIIDTNNVNWKTILEDYDTSTASGRLHINIMLSIAQDEADRTSERIKTVFDHKILNGEVTNNSIPYGFDIIDKKLVVNEEQATRVREIFDEYELKKSILSTQRWYINKYNENISYEFISRMLKRELYIGKKRDNHNFCEAIISKEQFERINKVERKQFSRNAKYGAYMFSGIIYCDSCGRMMNGTICHNPKPVKYYWCRYGARFTNCTHNHRCRESTIESKVLEELNKYINDGTYNIIIKERKSNKSSKDTLKRKLTRLKELYVEELIDMNQYKADYNMYISKLNELELIDKDANINNSVEYIKSLAKNPNYIEIYSQLDSEHKRLFWHKIIDKIVITDNNDINIFFKI